MIWWSEPVRYCKLEMQEFLEEEREMIFEAMKLAPSRRTVANFLNIPMMGEYLLLLLESLLYFSLPSDFTFLISLSPLSMSPAGCCSKFTSKLGGTLIYQQSASNVRGGLVTRPLADWIRPPQDKSVSHSSPLSLCRCKLGFFHVVFRSKRCDLPFHIFDYAPVLSENSF